MKILVVALLVMVGMSCGCSEDPKSLARVSLEKDTLVTPSTLHVTLRDGRSTWHFGPGDIGPDSRYTGQWWTPEVETASDGTLIMDFQIMNDTGGIVSAGTVSMTLREDWRWGIGIHRHSGPRDGQAFGEFGSKNFAITDSVYTETSSDSIWVIWGGNSISNPVIY